MTTINLIQQERRPVRLSTYIHGEDALFFPILMGLHRYETPYMDTRFCRLWVRTRKHKHQTDRIRKVSDWKETQ